MVAAGIAAIVALGIADMLSNQNKEVKAIGEKLATKELELQLKNMLSNPDYCNCLLRNKKFNTTAGSEAIVAADQITSLKTGYSTGPLDAVPCTAIATDFVPPAGSNIPDSTMKVGSVGLTNMTLVSPATYKADLQVSFSGTVRAIKPIKTSVQFAINPIANTATDRPFVACSSMAVTPNLICRTVVDVGPGPHFVSNPRCNADEFVLSGGGHCEGVGTGLCGEIGGATIHYSAPDADRKGWSVDCYDETHGTDRCSRGYAICCKF